MRKPYKSIQVFKNPYLERLTHVHPITPLVVWLPVVGYLIWRSFVIHNLSVSSVLVLGVLGFIVWTLAEYLLHRFVFHFEGEGPIVQRLHFLIHGLHHNDPIDPTRLVMPPVASIILALILFNLFRGLLGIEWVEPFFAFFVVGYLCYDYIHFAVHHFTPRTRVGKLLKQSHMQHHYVSPNARWGVSSPFWDYVFGTLEDIKNKERAV
jgi:sterol desaturase/sphingolipid hydroxylase (fatty acid hydroxylase superfamily)